MCTLNHPYCLQNTPSMSIGSIGPGAWALDSRATWWCAATWVKWFAKPWPQSRRARWNFIERRKQLPQMLKTTVPTELQTSHFTLWSLLDFVNFLTELKWTEVVKWLFIQQSIGIHMHTTKIPSVSSVLPCYTSTSKSSTKCLACAATKDAPKAWCLVEKKSVAALFETWTWRFLPILDLTVCVPIENWLEKNHLISSYLSFCMLVLYAGDRLPRTHPHWLPAFEYLLQRSAAVLAGSLGVGAA